MAVSLAVFGRKAIHASKRLRGINNQTVCRNRIQIKGKQTFGQNQIKK